MNTTIVALQALYLKLGGSLTDTYDSIANGEEVGNYTTIPDMIEACAQKAGSGGGGSSLPAVTAEDNGSVLTVVEGDWDKAQSAFPFEVLEITFNGETGIISTIKTAAEIMALYAAGKCFGAVCNLGSEAEPNWTQLHFGIMNIDDGTYMLYANIQASEQLAKLDFAAASADSVMTAQIGG